MFYRRGELQHLPLLDDGHMVTLAELRCLFEEDQSRGSVYHKQAETPKRTTWQTHTHTAHMCDVQKKSIVINSHAPSFWCKQGSTIHLSSVFQSVTFVCVSVIYMFFEE